MKRPQRLRMCVATAAAGVVTCLPSGAFAQESSSNLEIYGFAQADYVQDFKRVDPAWDDTLRPSRIPTSPGAFGSDGQAIISVRQSRFGAMGSFPVQEKTLKTKF